MTVTIREINRERGKLHDFINGRKDIDRAPEHLLKNIYSELFAKRIHAWNAVRDNNYTVDLKNNSRLDVEDLEKWFDCTAEQAAIALKMMVNYGWGFFNKEAGVITLHNAAVENIAQIKPEKPSEKGFSVIIGSRTSGEGLHAQPQQQQAGILHR